ncbi:MAG: helix-turn-helix domain-containing protein, partial [Alphaproteobacteria bacterium]|nr:helix-turn-helix domain-containing protein [Alphaproteobacteria bacterium]
LIARSQPDEIVIAAADQLIQERIRTNSDSQHLAATQRLGARHPRLLQIVRRMEENLETPLTREELVADLDISTRQMERLFRKYLHKTPDRYYLDLRLDRARHMLLQTQMRVLEVALACGFVSASHFSRCYRDRFNRTPRNERGLPPPENKKTARH